MERMGKMMGDWKVGRREVYGVMRDEKIWKEMEKVMEGRERKESEENKNKEEGK